MHYRPFSFNEYPVLDAEKGKYPPSFRAQTSCRGFTYYQGTVSFSFVSGARLIPYEADIGGSSETVLGWPDEVKRTLFYSLGALCEADRADIFEANQPRNTQFEVTRLFRGISQSFGGRRYVALCWDAIDANLGRCLYPYMYVDLISAIHVCYNKNVTHDVKGLLDGILELRNLYSLIGMKSSPEAYDYFASVCLKSPALAPAMKQLIFHSLIPSRFNPKEFAPRASADYLALFGKEELFEILANLPGGMKPLVREFFARAGNTIDADYVNAYLKNPLRDVQLISKAAFYDSLPERIKHALSFRLDINPLTPVADLVRMYESMESPEQKEEFLRRLGEVGRGDVADALGGKPFLLTRLSLSEFALILPYADINSATMRPRVSVFLVPLLMRGTSSDALDSVLLGVDPIAYEKLLEMAFERNAFHKQSTRYQVMKRTGQMTKQGYREWKYHA